MLLYLKVAEAPNLKELCGVLKWFATLKATASCEQLACCMEVLRWLHRHQVKDKFPDKFEVVTPFINAALMRSLENVRKQGCKPTEFLKLYSMEVSLLLPTAALQVVTSHSGDWLEVEPQLQELVSSCGVGMQLFGFAIKKTLATMVANEINKHLDELILEASITADLVMSTTKSMLSALKTVPNVQALPERRTIQATSNEQCAKLEHETPHLSFVMCKVAMFQIHCFMWFTV
jgi:hypothetical protein